MLTLKTLSIVPLFSGENDWAAAEVCLIAVIGIYEIKLINSHTGEILIIYCKRLKLE